MAASLLGAVVCCSTLVRATAGASSCSDPLHNALDDRGTRTGKPSVSLLQSALLHADKLHSDTIQNESAHDGTNGSHQMSKSTNEVTQDLSCIRNTGGSCMIQNCHTWRGPTECSSGRCFCTAGHCSTAQGECVKRENQRIAFNFTLRNAKYNDHVIYLSSYSRELGLTRSMSDQSYFSLYELPGQAKGTHVQFLLGSEKWNTWVAAADRQQECDSNHNHEHSHCYSVIEPSAVPIERFSSTATEGLAVNIFAAPKYDGMPKGVQSVMIEPYKYERRFFLGTWSWKISLSWGDGGAGSYWIPEPPLPMKLKPYTGPRCKWSCGSYGSGSGTRNGARQHGFIDVMSVLATLGCIVWHR